MADPLTPICLKSQLPKPETKAAEAKEEPAAEPTSAPAEETTAAPTEAAAETEPVVSENAAPTEGKMTHPCANGNTLLSANQKTPKLSSICNSRCH